LKREQNRPNERPNGLRCSGEKLEKCAADQLAGELGFEPRLTESESAIPLLFRLVFFTKCALTLPVSNQTVRPNLQSADRVGFHSRHRTQHLDLDRADSRALLPVILVTLPRVGASQAESMHCHDTHAHEQEHAGAACWPLFVDAYS
jgi:hypothetical protein